MNIRENGGLRLCDNGYHFLINDIELDSYTVEIYKIRLNHKFLLELDKFMDCPYYLVRGRWPKIILFSEHTYMWCCLHEDFKSFLNGYKI